MGPAQAKGAGSAHGKSGGKGYKCEHLPSMYDSVTITGGDPAARKYRNDYSKANHAQQDAARAVESEFPAAGLPFWGS